ncbi:MAG: MFS transporter [Spirochaetes bacterium]|nr:MFS transporter [Spirochaetota bacterium]MBU1082045.1 MFS transporter [Spirochaetota bacterium]
MASSTNTATPGEAPLVRTSFIWTLYLLLGLFAFMLSMIGPMVPYLQDEFSISYTLAGLHQSAFALGMVTMGLAGSSVIRRLGIALSVWGGMGSMLVGLLVMVLARGPAMTLGGIFAMSLGGTVALAAIQTALANGPAAHRGRMIMEANVMASVFAMLVPLVLLAGARWFLGWRIVFPAMLVSLVAVASFGIPATIRHQETRDEKADAGSGRLGAPYWRMWIIVFFGVTVEWAISFWCMTYLLGLPGRSRELAAAGTVLLGLSAVAGRFVSSRLTRRFSEEQLFIIVTVIVLAGFPLYWLRANVPLTFLGLALCGFGSSNFFPLGLSLALGHAPGNAAKASSLMPVASGSAIGLAPFLLGRLADATDIRIAMAYIPVGIAIILAIALADRLFSRRRVSS